jgi:hypothetical protein
MPRKILREFTSGIKFEGDTLENTHTHTHTHKREFFVGDCQYTPWNRVLLGKLAVAQFVKKSPSFM